MVTTSGGCPNGDSTLNWSNVADLNWSNVAEEAGLVRAQRGVPVREVGEGGHLTFPRRPTGREDASSRRAETKSEEQTDRQSLGGK